MLFYMTVIKNCTHVYKIENMKLFADSGHWISYFDDVYETFPV